MPFLSDHILRANFSGKSPLIKGMTSARINDSVKGCAVDLHIGSIFKPGVEAGKPGSAAKPLQKKLILKEGETALIQTNEEFDLDERHAAFAFPASSVSIQGLLMTNPGHVDPGYSGPLHVTVINMSREPFILAPGERFLRAFIYDLGSTVAEPKSGQPKKVEQELLDQLAPDFLSVGARTAEAAKRQIDIAVSRGQWLQFVVPALFSVVGAVLVGIISNMSLQEKYDEKIKALEDTKATVRLQALEINYPTAQRLDEIEKQLRLVRVPVKQNTKRE